jgi:hypothetical protein
VRVVFELETFSLEDAGGVADHVRNLSTHDVHKGLQLGSNHLIITGAVCDIVLIGAHPLFRQIVIVIIVSLTCEQTDVQDGKQTMKTESKYASHTHQEIHPTRCTTTDVGWRPHLP